MNQAAAVRYSEETTVEQASDMAKGEAVNSLRIRPEISGPEADLELLARVRAGDRAAFERLYRLYHPRLNRFLWTLMRRPTLVEEVLNDTMMVVWNRPDSFKGASKLSTWIFSIAYRKAMKGLRKQDEAIEDAEADRRISTDAAPDESSSRARVRQLLSQAVAELSPAHRAVVDLTYFHELGYREIAVILDRRTGKGRLRSGPANATPNSAR